MNMIKATGLPLVVFLLSVYVIATMKNVGTMLMAPAIAVMWGVGVFMAIIMPAQRRTILTETLGFIAGYNGSLFMFHKAIAITAGVSAEMLMETFNQPIATATANAIPGYLQTAFWVTSAFVPISFLGLQGKRFISFRKSVSKSRMLRQLRSVRGGRDAN